jgi:hypothetical protein
VSELPTESISLSRWSRLKRAAQSDAATVVRPPLPGGEGDDVRDAVSRAASLSPTLPPGGREPDAAAEFAELPPLSTISLTEDFTPFMQAKVPQALKQQALKALFKEPHFNVMDGLDIYIDDYTVFEPISPEVMATLSSWKAIMNPTQQVVTEGGYAVDVESDEGKAVLAERARIAALNAPDAPLLPGEIDGADEPQNAETTEPLDQPEPAVIVNAPHPRYGKRVGDFVATDHALDDPVVATASPENNTQ